MFQNGHLSGQGYVTGKNTYLVIKLVIIGYWQGAGDTGISRPASANSRRMLAS